MARNKLWIYVGLALAFGFGLKQFQVEPEVRTRTFGFSDGLGEDSVYNRNSSDSKGLVSAQLPNSETVIAEVEIEPPSEELPLPDTAGTAKGTKKGDAKKTAKKDDKKKKKAKKKKKTSGKTESQVAQSDLTNDANEEKNDADDTGAAGVTGGFAGRANARNTNDNGVPTTLEEWERVLLRDPDFKETSTFVSYFQSGLVSAEVFYGIVNLMLEDPRHKMRQLGVMALGSTPSPRSFAELTLFIESEPAGSPHKIQGRAYQQSYADVQHLRSLAGALNPSTEPLVTMTALELIRMSAQNNLRQPSSQSDSDQPQAANPNGRYFNAMVPVLTRFSAIAQDSDLRAAAASTLQALQALLGQPHTS